MKYDELLDHGKKIFNFHPDADFSSIGELLDAGVKATGQYKYYEMCLSHYAEYLAKYCDENKEGKQPLEDQKKSD